MVISNGLQFISHRIESGRIVDSRDHFGGELAVELFEMHLDWNAWVLARVLARLRIPKVDFFLPVDHVRHQLPHARQRDAFERNVLRFKAEPRGQCARCNHATVGALPIARPLRFDEVEVRLASLKHLPSVRD